MEEVENGDKGLNDSSPGIGTLVQDKDTKSAVSTNDSLPGNGLPPTHVASTTSMKGARPKELGQISTGSCGDVQGVLNTLCLDTEGTSIMNGDVREEKIKKWKQAGSALRKALSRITRSKSHKKSQGTGEKYKKHDKIAKVKHGSKSSCASGGRSHKVSGAKSSKTTAVSGKAVIEDSSLASNEENASTPVNSPGDPMNQMLEEFKMTAQSGTSASSSDVQSKIQPTSASTRQQTSSEAPASSGRQLPSFAELKEKIKRMTSGSNGSGKPSDKSGIGNITKKRHKVLRHSKSQDSNDKGHSQSSESEIEDFQAQKHYKPSARHSFKEKRKSIDNAALSLLKCGLSPGLTQVGDSGKSKLPRGKESQNDTLPDVLSDSSLSDGEVPSVASLSGLSGGSKDDKCASGDDDATKGKAQSRRKPLEGSGTSKQNKGNIPMSRATQALREAESFANLADVESCNSEPEMGSSDDGLGEGDPAVHALLDRELTPTRLNQLTADRRSEKGESDVSIPTLCSTSEEEEATAGQIRMEKYQGKTIGSTNQERAAKKYHGGWDVHGDGSDDDESDLYDDIPELRLRIDNTSSSEGEVNPVLRITRADIDSLPDLLSDSTSSEEEGAEADDEFECDCPMCRLNREGSREAGWSTGDTLEEARQALFQDTEEEVAQARQFAVMLLSSQARRDSILDLMFQNVILQMISVYPDLLNDQAPPPVSPTLFEQLPAITIDQVHTDEGNTCPICLCNFEVGEEAKSLPCQHNFHTLCIQAWLKKSGTCPVCRHVLTSS